MRLLAFGSNGAGQLGLGHSDDTSVPQEPITNFAQNELPVKVTAGGNHTLILCSTGTVYQAGSLDPTMEANDSPASAWNKVASSQQPNGLGKIKLCSSTWSTATVVDESDRLITWGTGDKGELGRGRGVNIMTTPGEPFQPIKESEPRVSIVDLASSVFHTVFVLSNGDVYGWGNGRKGQLGQPAEVVWQPRKINDIKFRVTRAVCGREFTYLVGDQATGSHEVLGADKWGIRTSAPPSCRDWNEIGASWSNIFILKSDGTLVSWGRNDHGQLGPSTLPPIKQIAVGSEHVLALTNLDTLLAWGWGEHGNCGPEAEKGGDVRSTCNEVVIKGAELQNAKIGLGAGCATSWVWINDEV